MTIFHVASRGGRHRLPILTTNCYPLGDPDSHFLSRQDILWNRALATMVNLCPGCRGRLVPDDCLSTRRWSTRLVAFRHDQSSRHTTKCARGYGRLCLF